MLLTHTHNFFEQKYQISKLYILRLRRAVYDTRKKRINANTTLKNARSGVVEAKREVYKANVEATKKRKKSGGCGGDNNDEEAIKSLNQKKKAVDIAKGLRDVAERESDHAGARWKAAVSALEKAVANNNNSNSRDI